MPAALLAAALLFAAIVVYSPRIIAGLTVRNNLRRPHPYLILVFRLWFGVLTLATIWLLFHRKS